MKDKSFFIVVFFSIIIVLLLLLIPNKAYKKEMKLQNKLYSSFKKINDETKGRYKLINDEKLSNDIINLVYYNEEQDDYLTYFVDSKVGKIVGFNSLLKNNSLGTFLEKEKELLMLKYPTFIVDGILNENTKKVYLVKDNEIIIYYKDVVTNPQYNEKLSLKINNNEIKGLLNYDVIFDEEYVRENAYDYDPSKKYIAFTFDDGPSKKNTKDIVDYLSNNKAHATFFMLGSLISSNQDIIKYVKDNNNEIGSHTYNHKNLKRISMNSVKSEVESTEEVYKLITGEELKLLRPPYGAITDKIKETFNYSYILWNIDTEDWRYKDSDYLYNFVINNVNDGDIILMHDIHETTKVAVERILPELYVRGYRVVTVSELAQIKNINLENHKSYRSLK